MSQNNEDDTNYKLLFKLIIVGESCVGKSNIIVRYTEGEFKNIIGNTLGVELYNKYINIKDKYSKLQIYDTAGQERYHSIVSNYFRGSHGCFIVYDITNQESFDKIEFWYQSVKQKASNDVSIILVGNKCDLEEQRVITKEKGEEKAKELNIPFFETSALSDININEIFKELVENIYDKIGVQIEKECSETERQSSVYEEKIVNISPKKKEPEKKGCC